MSDKTVVAEITINDVDEDCTKLISYYYSDGTFAEHEIRSGRVPFEGRWRWSKGGELQWQGLQDSHTYWHHDDKYERQFMDILIERELLGND